MCCVCLHCASDISESYSVVSDSLQPCGLSSPWSSPGQNTGVGSYSLLQGIFPTQGSNPGLLHCWWILYQLSYQGSPTLHYFIFNLPNILFFQYYQVDQKIHCGFFIKSYRKTQMKLLANSGFTETLLSR